MALKHEDRKSCAVIGHKNIASLSSYDIVISHEAGVLADAIDIKPPSYESATAVCEPAFAAVDTDSLGAASACTGTGFMLHAAGTSFSNVTFNVMPRLTLNRKRRREQKAAFAKLSKRSEYSHFIALNKNPVSLQCLSILHFCVFTMTHYLRSCNVLSSPSPFTI